MGAPLCVHVFFQACPPSVCGLSGVRRCAAWCWTGTTIGSVGSCRNSLQTENLLQTEICCRQNFAADVFPPPSSSARSMSPGWPMRDGVRNALRQGQEVGCTLFMHGRSRISIHSPSHPCNAGTEHVGFSPTRQISPALSAKRCEVFGESHDG